MFHDEPQLVYPCEGIMNAGAKDLNAVQIVAYEDQSFVLTESGRILTWGHPNDGLLGRDTELWGKKLPGLRSQHFIGEMYKVRPPKTLAELPGLVAHISLHR